MSTKKIQRGGNCNLGTCSLQMGGGCGCAYNNRKPVQMGGKKSQRSRKNKKNTKRSKKSKSLRGGAIRAGSEVSLRNK